MRRVHLALLCVGVAATGGAAAFAFRDPVPAIAAELRAAAADPKNHTPYADLVRAELASVGHRRTATFVMPCFWSGEAHFGGQPGVYRTTPGYLGGKEVVRVEFDPALTDADELAAAPDENVNTPGGCRYDAAAVTASRANPGFRPDTEFPAWYLRQTDGLKFVPLTPAQTARVDSLVHAGKPYDQLLSPGQRAMLDRAKRDPDGNGTDYAGGERLWVALGQSK